MILKGRRSCFSFIGNIVYYNLDLSTAFHVFDSAIAPTMLYGSEIWAMPNFKSKLYEKHLPFFCIEEVLREHPIEAIHLQFAKICLGVKKNVVNEAIYGETGRYPLFIRYFKSIVSFWTHIINANENSLLHLAYQEDRKLSDQGKDTWCFGLRRILDYYGQTHVWDSQGVGIKNFPMLFEKEMKSHFDVLVQQGRKSIIL